MRHQPARIQFGIVIPTELPSGATPASWAPAVQHALSLAAGHLTSAWTVDHLQFGPGRLLEGFASLAYFAALNPRLRFGNAVLCNSFRNPAHVAKMAATLQFLSAGRFVLGMGACSVRAEHRAYGFDFPPGGVRVAQLDEALQLIKAMWTEPCVTFQGRYCQVREAYCEPRPDPLPEVMIGAFGPRMLRLAARHADTWNVSSTGPKAYAALWHEFALACAETGRQPASVGRSWIGGCACAPTRRQAETLAAGRWSAAEDADDFGFVGTPDDVVAQMRPLAEMGIHSFALDFAGIPDTAGLELFIREVLPAWQAPLASRPA
jgi:alkanesulfonate monooxygenase SsuD/methylene tetrahydromethanopterin reductase-like flavin-dependent oxidoreductase (luciferase family)